MTCLARLLPAAALLALALPGHAANSGAWALDGNAPVPNGAFLGYADPASRGPLDLRVAGQTVFRLWPGDQNNGAGQPVSYNLIAGAPTNGFIAPAHGVTIAGGGGSDAHPASGPNRVSDHYGTVGGGSGNQAGNFNGASAGDASFATVAGGVGNRASGPSSAIGGGSGNRASFNYGNVAGGSNNHASGFAASVAGGVNNIAFGEISHVAGGVAGHAMGDGAIVAGGSGNCAGGDYSFAAGYGAKVRPGFDPGAGSACNGLSYPGGAGDKGSFVWADTAPAAFASSGANQFAVRAEGGVGINTAPFNHLVELTVQTDRDGVADYANLWLKQKSGNHNGVLISVGDGSGSNNAGFYIDHYNGTAQARRAEFAPSGAVTIRSNVTQGASGVTLAANSGAWSSLSDRRLKTALQAVDAGAILDKVAALPMSTWSYIAQGEGVRHIGPMAQDFAAAFAVGENDTTISTIDADGVALAAIQGLNAKLERENAQLRGALEALAARLGAIEARREH